MTEDLSTVCGEKETKTMLGVKRRKVEISTILKMTLTHGVIPRELERVRKFLSGT